MTWIFVLFVLMAKSSDQSTVEITDLVETPYSYGTQFGAEGKNMTMTCRSDLESVTLEYSSVVYNNTKNNSGVYSVSFTKVATKSDNGQTVKCRAVNVTGYQFEKTAYVYITAEAVRLTIGGVGEFGEGDTTNISCTMAGSRYLPSSTLFKFKSTNNSPKLVNVLSNTTLQTRTEVFDNITGTYTVTQRVTPVLVEVNMDQGVIFCEWQVNGSFYYANEKYIVFHGPKENSVGMTGFQTAREGNNGKWTCYSNKGNPQVTFTWFNGSTQFNPETPVLSPYSTEVSQEWNFKYSRDFSGSNITCVVTGYKNITVAKTRQFGQITFAPELAIRGDHVVDEGDTVNLTCEVVAASPMTVAKWGDPVKSNRLVIPNIQSNANGRMYTCHASNSVNNEALSIRLNVQYGPEIFIRSNQWVKEGSNISITSGVSGNPVPIMSWRKNGNDSVLSSDKTLFLASVTRKQAGVYTFKATSHRLRKNNLTEEFSKNASVVLEVRYGPGDSLIFSPSLKNQTLTVDSGQTIPQITCKADCVPNCEFRWTQYNRKSEIQRSSNTVLNLGSASSSKAGLYVCEATNYVGAEKFTRNVTFQLHVRYKPEIQSIGINNYKNTYNENSPISVTTVIKAFPRAWVKWGLQNPLNTKQFMPLDSRYNINRTVNCLYDCIITEVLTLNQPLCTDSRNKYSLFAGNEKGNSSIRTTHYDISVTCEPRLANVSLTNQTYRTCEGAELNMTVTFVAIPGPFIAWYLLPNTNRYVHYHEGRGAGYDKTYHTSTYRIPFMSRLKFGTYVVDGNSFKGGSNSRAYIRVVKDHNCTSLGLTVDSTTLSPTISATYSDPSTTSRSMAPRHTTNKAPRLTTNRGKVFAGIASLLLVTLVMVGNLVFFKIVKKTLDFT